MSEAAASSQSESRDSRGGPPGGAAGLPSRTGKAVARRIDLSYHKRPHPMRMVRRALIVLAVVGAVGWVVLAMSLRGERIYNPGPVAASHAMFENNCAACHDGGEAGQRVATTSPATRASGGFFRTVSDAACIRCHNADVHAQTQTQFVARLPESTKAVHSSNCTHCHVEHRGHDALAARGDLLCTSCHAVLKSNVENRQTQLPPSVTKFAAGEHPAFGRYIKTDAGGRIESPHVLYFNHAHHLTLRQFKDCSVCHSTTTLSPPSSKPGIGVTPPYIVEGAVQDRGHADLGPGRYMLPVTYERHCAGCHSLDTEGIDPAKLSPVIRGIKLRHGPMEGVRAQIAEWLAATAPAATQPVTAAAPATKAAAPAPQKSSKFQRPKPSDAPAPPVSRDEWLKTGASLVRSDLVKEYINTFANSKTPLQKQLARRAQEARSAIEAGHKVPDDGWGAGEAGMLRTMEFYGAYAAKNACAMCHGIESPALRGGAGATTRPAATSAPALSGPAGATPPSTRPSGLMLATVPTGTPPGPRRWFTSSVFDHEAHRAMNCIECHLGVEQSRSGSDDLHLPVMESCLACHHSGGSAKGSAGNNCVTCHVYHDRSSRTHPTTRLTLKELVGGR